MTGDSARGSAPATQGMRAYLRAIGTGARRGRDLTAEEAEAAMALIVSGEATAAQAGAFLMIQRYKGETPEEMLGFARAVRASASLIQPRVEGLLDVGSPYDGRAKSAVLSPAASIVAAAAGVPVVMHGERGIGPKPGVTVGAVLSELGMDDDQSPLEAERALRSTGLAYLRSERSVPRVHALKDLRNELGLRSAIATVEKLYNPASADYALMGMAHLPYAEKMRAAASGMGFRRALIVQGVEGCEDAPASRPCRAFLCDFESPGDYGAMEELRLDPGRYGLTAGASDDGGEITAATSAEACESALNGHGGANREAVVWNAAIRVWLARRAAALDDAVDIARGAIDSGAAARKLAELRTGGGA